MCNINPKTPLLQAKSEQQNRIKKILLRFSSRRFVFDTDPVIPFEKSPLKLIHACEEVMTLSI